MCTPQGHKISFSEIKCFTMEDCWYLCYISHDGTGSPQLFHLKLWKMNYCRVFTFMIFRTEGIPNCHSGIIFFILLDSNKHNITSGSQRLLYENTQTSHVH